MLISGSVVALKKNSKIRLKRTTLFASDNICAKNEHHSSESWLKWEEIQLQYIEQTGYVVGRIKISSTTIPHHKCPIEYYLDCAKKKKM